METEKQDNHAYKGWLNSDSFWKRALATYGYAFVGNIIIFIPIFILIAIFGGLVGAALLG